MMVLHEIAEQTLLTAFKTEDPPCRYQHRIIDRHAARIAALVSNGHPN
jgi:hypothetical protein